VIVAKNTSTRAAATRARRAGGDGADARRDAERIRRAAEADAARIREEAEEHARRLVLDARASADGVRAEGMELVSQLREMGDALRANAERLLSDIQAIHSRMVGELRRVEPEGGGSAVPNDNPQGADEAAPPADEALEIPDFVSRG
jgi:cell division septum initiation protein DivIVA